MADVEPLLAWVIVMRFMWALLATAVWAIVQTGTASGQDAPPGPLAPPPGLTQGMAPPPGIAPQPIPLPQGLGPEQSVAIGRDDKGAPTGLERLPNFGVAPQGAALPEVSDPQKETKTAADLKPPAPKSAQAKKSPERPARTNEAPPADPTAPGSNTGKPEEQIVAKAQQAPGNGTYTYDYEIDLPKFRGLEPKLALVFDSSTGLRPHGATQAMLGTGWRINGLSEITRVSRVHGAPRFDDATDVFQADDHELDPCLSQTISPGCSSGGTHFARMEDWRRYQRDTAGNRWIVTQPNGVQHIYSSVSTLGAAGSTPSNVLTNHRWLLTSIVDLHGNTVTYSYTCEALPVCWLSTIAYNGTVVTFRYQARPETVTSGQATIVSSFAKRLASIDIVTGGTRDHVYGLAYSAGVATGLTRVASVTRYGRDATVDTQSGAVTSGSSLPTTTFAYHAGNDPQFTQTGDCILHYSAIGEYNCGFSAGFQQILSLYGDFNGDGKTDKLNVATWDGNIFGLKFDPGSNTSRSPRWYVISASIHSRRMRENTYSVSYLRTDLVLSGVF